MDKIAKRYYQLKAKQKEIEGELSELRNQIIGYCEELGVQELETGSFRVRIVQQERKEYDNNKLYHALPDPALWRMLSKPDSAKIASLIKLNVIEEEHIKDTYAIKCVSLLQVDKV